MTLEGLARAIEAHPEWARQLEAYALLSARLLPLVVLTPLLGLKHVTPVLRTTAALALALGCAPAAALAEGASLDAHTLLAECLAGAGFAAIASLPLFALSASGRMVDLVRGVSHPGERDLVEGEPSSALGQLHAMAGLALFFAIGGHRLVVRAFADGLSAVPLGGVELSRSALFGFVELGGKAISFGAALAAPAFASVLLVEIFLGLIARAAPTIPVFHAGMPLRALAGLFAFALSLAIGLGAFREELGHAVTQALAWLSAAP